MKNIIFTLILCFISSLGFSQLKVLSSGDCKVAGETMRVYNSIQRVKIGQLATAPAFDLHIARSGSQTGFIVERTDAGNFMKYSVGNTGNALYFKNDKRFKFAPAVDLNTNTPGPEDFFFYGDAWSVPAQAGNLGLGLDNPNEKLHIDGNGKADAWLINSDMRLKKNVKKSSYGLEEVMELNPIEFNYNGLAKTNSKPTHIGISAQELRKVVPELVEEFESVTYSYDEDGTQKYESSETYLQIRDNEVKWILLGAIQDQQAIINEQNERLNQLENLVNDLAKNGFGVIETQNEINVELENSAQAILGQNRPNPFGETTQIPFMVPNEANDAKLLIYDNLGSLIKTVEIDQKGQGVVNIQASNLASGNYVYKLVVDGKDVMTKKMVLTK